MNPVQGLREFINARLSAAAVEIFTVVQQTIIQYQEEVDAKILDISWRGGTEIHTTGDQRQHTGKEEQLCNKGINSTLDQREPEPPQIEEEHSEVEPLWIKNEEEEPHPPQIKDEPLELFTGLDEEQHELKREAETFMVTVIDEQSELKELEPDIEQLLSFGCAVDEIQDQRKGQHGDLGITRNEEWTLSSRQYTVNVDPFPIPLEQCKTDSDKKCLTCGFCGKTFKFLSQIQAHNRTHTGEKPYSCETCDKSFRTRSQLMTHKRNHTGEKPFSCELCGKCFSRQHILSIHKRTHTGEKPYSCEICGKCFTRKDNLMCHKKSHTGGDPYSCETCGKSFRRKDNFLYHKKSHTCKKSYPCETCGKSFTIPRNLLAHVRTHTGEKPYICEKCGKGFSQHSHLFYHKRTHTGEKPYSCETCGKCFSRKDKLKDHKKTHKGEKHFSETWQTFQ